MLLAKNRCISFIFLTLLFVLAGCSSIPGVNAPSSNISSSQAQPSGNKHKLFVFLSGFTSQLSTTDVASNGGYGSDSDFFGDGHIQPSLRDKFPNSYFLVYSYHGFTADGKPVPYTCPLSIDSDIADLAVGLRNQISQFLRSHPSTDIYVIGHSLGGVIAFSFLAQMIEGKNNLLNSFPNGGKLKGIFTLDSPIGGVTNNGVYELISSWHTFQSCSGANFIHQPIVKELNDLFNSTTLPDFRGATASIDGTITLFNQNINQTVALDAMKYGITVSTFGNTNDIMWQPDICTASTIQNFSSTQWLREVKAGRNSQGGAVYSRSFTAGPLSCSSLLSKTDPANHFAVFTEPPVQTAIQQVITGEAPDALNAISPKPDFSQFVGLWKYFGTVMTITNDGKAIYIGRTYVFCTNDPQPPCDGGDQGLAGLNTTILFTSVNGNTITGVITAGSGDRDQNNNIIHVGGNITATLIAKAKLQVSDGRTLVSCVADPNAMECISNT